MPRNLASSARRRAVRRVSHQGRLAIAVCIIIAASCILFTTTVQVASAGSIEAVSFLGNPKYTIPLPAALEKADRALRMVGLSGDADELKAAMNHAAEMAVADARPVFKQAVQRMTVADAKGILTGGETSATEYFRRTASEQLTTRFRPIVARATAKLKLGALYDQYAGKAAQVGLISAHDANLNDYVTSKALDGLFGAIADEEVAIRKDPMGQASTLLKKVFGAL
jgi:uncharacterized protein DUF4197